MREDDEGEYDRERPEDREWDGREDRLNDPPIRPPDRVEAALAGRTIEEQSKVKENKRA